MWFKGVFKMISEENTLQENFISSYILYLTMKTKHIKTNYNWGFASLIIGIFGIISLFIVPLGVLPLFIIAIIFAGIQKQQKFTIYAKISMFISIIGIILFVLATFANLDMDMHLSNSVNCENLNEVECLEFPKHCGLCGETIVSSYASCHSIKFCENIPLE
ncbi:MAG: hypothetical protein K9N07_11425 [Candidatus Cloacimonetes bacterium]|nr:hypothetical protein [Candidatus Cloacimonadota bacterium]